MFFARPYWNLGEVRRMVAQLPDYHQRKFDTDLGIEPTYEGEGHVTRLGPRTLARALPVVLALKASFKAVLAHAQRFVADFEAKKAPYELGDAELRALSQAEFASRWRRLIEELYFETETTYFTIIYNTSNSKTVFNGAFEAAKKALGGELDYLALVSGLENLSHMRPLVELFETAGKLKQEGRGVDDETVRAFAWRWRHHGRKELDIRVPRWSEEPALVREMLEQAVKDHDAELHPDGQARKAHAAYVRERDKAARALGWYGRRRFLAGLELVRAYAWWREEVRDRSSYLYYLVRRWSLEAARRFVERGWLYEADDVWYLPFEEAVALAAGELPAEEARRRARAGRRMVRSFRNFKNPPEIGVGYGMAKPAPAGALRGIGCSPGRVEARARVVHGLDEMGRVEQGDVLVTHFTDPGWTPLFARLAGVVTETGGVLAHAAVISREYGIPAVLAVAGATERIPDGARVVVDGTGGTVEIVK
jgi:pyruvate,water dikinase